MKELLINILTKFISCTKSFIIKILNNLRFLNKKSITINALYNPIFKKKSNKIYKLSFELDTIKNESKNIDAKMNMIKKQNELYNKKNNSLNCFQSFILNNKL